MEIKCIKKEFDRWILLVISQQRVRDKKCRRWRSPFSGMDSGIDPKDRLVGDIDRWYKLLPTVRLSAGKLSSRISDLDYLKWPPFRRLTNDGRRCQVGECGYHGVHEGVDGLKSLEVTEEVGHK